MKKIIKVSLLIIVLYAILLTGAYLLFAFVQANTDPFLWTSDVRCALVFTWVALISFAPLIIMITNDEL